MSEDTPKSEAAADDPNAKEKLFTALYAELRQLADRELRRNPAAGVSPTTLVHEAYLNLSHRASTQFADNAHYLGYVARAMRGILIDSFRRHQAVKRGSEFKLVELDTQIGEQLSEEKPLMRLSGALDELAQHEPALAELVDLKYFCGFSFAEIAKLRGLSERTVQRDWQKVRLLLYQDLKDDPL